MKVTPMLFQPEMVRALWNDWKTQTRRLRGLDVINERPNDYDFRGFVRLGEDSELHAVFWDRLNDRQCLVRSLYGKPGDLLYPRERMLVIGVQSHGSRVSAIRVNYEATNTQSDWIWWPERLKGTPVIGKCLSYGGFREASRMTLELTDVRVQRVQDISRDDIRAEGVGLPPSPGDTIFRSWFSELHSQFANLWDSINEKRGYGFDVNPYVWHLTFDVHKQNVDQLPESSSQSRQRLNC